MPIGVLHQQEIDPLRIVREQTMTAESARKYIFQKGARLLVGHFGKSRLRPGLRVAFDDKSARIPIELIRVGREDAGVIFTEGEGEAMKQLIGSVPDVLVRSHTQDRLKFGGKRLPGGAVDAICAYK